jgi:hypothetical protein
MMLLAYKSISSHRDITALSIRPVTVAIAGVCEGSGKSLPLPIIVPDIVQPIT